MLLSGYIFFLLVFFVFADSFNFAVKFCYGCDWFYFLIIRVEFELFIESVKYYFLLISI